MNNSVNKINNLTKIGIYSVGILASFIAIENATAVNLINGGTDENAFLTNYGITKIGEVEGIAGGASKELFFGVNGSSTGTPQSSADFTWNDGTEYDWTLTWDTQENLAQFTVESSTIQYDFDNSELADPILDKFNAFGLIAKADGRDSSRVEAGTKINLNVDTIDFSNGDFINDLSTVGNDAVSSTASSGTQTFNKQFYVLSDADRANGVEITKMTGSFSLDWDSVNPQEKNANSRISFELKLFDPPANSTASTPEPGSIISLFALGALGFVRSQRKSN